MCSVHKLGDLALSNNDAHAHTRMHARATHTQEREREVYHLLSPSPSKPIQCLKGIRSLLV